MSEKFCTAARNTMRPMRPKPLMPILMVMGQSPGVRKRIVPWNGRAIGPQGPMCRNSLADDPARHRDDVADGEPEQLEQVGRGRGLAVAVKADHRGGAVLPPAV